MESSPSPLQVQELSGGMETLVQELHIWSGMFGCNRSWLCTAYLELGLGYSHVSSIAVRFFSVHICQPDVQKVANTRLYHYVLR